MHKLKIADDLSLPLDAVTQTIAILAKRRAGKSYTMRRLAEQLFKASQQIVIVDPKGDQWGVRSAADGKSPGLSIVILGGERGDVALESSGGEIVAKLVVEERVSVLLDLSLFRKHEVATFMTAFLENVYRLKAREIYRTPVMLVIDEADAIAPQKPQKGEERMLGAAEDIVRRGGQRGIGCILVTQRSAVLNKNVLTQAQILVALRTIAPQDLAAMDAWIDVHGTLEQRKELMASLPSLPVGDAWFWSPGWPTTDGIFKRVHVLAIDTFDSGATPKPGEKPVEPKQAAEVDLNALKERMAATIERAKADDPRELRKQINDLKKELSKSSNIITAKSQPDPDHAAIDAAYQRGRREGMQTIISELEPESELNRLAGVADSLQLGIAQIQTRRKFLETQVESSPVKYKQQPERIQPPRPTPQRPAHGPKVHKAESNGQLTGPEQRIIDAIAWLASLGNEEPEQPAVAFLAGYTYGGGAFNNPKGKLRGAGLVEYLGDRIRLTEAGFELANTPDAPLTTEELHRHVFDRLPGPERRILQPLLDSYPKPVGKEDLAHKAGYAPGAGSFNNPTGRLRSLGLIDYPSPGYAVAKSLLFLD